MFQINSPIKSTGTARQYYLYLAIFTTFLFSAPGGSQIAAQNPIRIERSEYFGYRDRKGIIVIPAWYSLAGEFSKEGIASVLDEHG